MSAAAAAHGGDDDDEAWEPPLLSWKGFQSWSVGCRAPAICAMFVGFTSKKLLLSKLIPAIKQKKRKCTGEGTEAGAFGSGKGIQAPPQRGAAQEAAVAAVSMRPGSGSSFGLQFDVPRRHSDAAVSNLDCLAMLRRNSDASVAALSGGRGGGYQRVWVMEEEEVGGAADRMMMMLPQRLPREVKLGGRRSDASVPRSGARGVCAHRRSFEGWMMGCRNMQKGEDVRQQLAVVGNQFLTPIAAAPVPTTARHLMPRLPPSGGLLLGQTARSNEADLKDRIILFV